MSKKTSIFEICSVSILNISRYTWDAWKKCYPGSNKQEWYNVTIPHSIIDFLLAAEEEEDIPPDTTYRVCVIDGEYFKWLERNEKENTEESRIQYINDMSDNDAYRLLKKNGMNRHESLVFMPFIIGRKKPFEKGEEIHVPEETRKRIASCIKEKAMVSDVFVGDNLISPGEMEQCEVDMANNIKNGTSIKKWGKRIDPQGASLMFLCLPIMIIDEVPEAKINIGELQDEFLFPEFIDFSECEGIAEETFEFANTDNKDAMVRNAPYLEDPFEAKESEQQMMEYLFWEGKKYRNEK